MHVAVWALVAVWLSSGHAQTDLIRYYQSREDCEYAAKVLTVPAQPMLCLDTTLPDIAKR